MNKMVSFVLVAILAGCSAEGPTAPTPVPETASQPPVVAAANPAPVALVPVPPGVRLNFYNNATFELFNDTADVLVVTSYITSFDDQVTPLEPKRSEPVQPGQSLNTSYNRGCVQLDVDQIGFAFYDQDGKQFAPQNNPEKVTECRTQPECTDREPVVEYGEWSEWADVLQADTVEQCFDEYEVRQVRTRTVTEHVCAQEPVTTTETEYQTTTRKREKTCPETCVDKPVSTLLDGGYCLNHPLGSPENEATWLGVSYSAFVKKVDEIQWGPVLDC